MSDFKDEMDNKFISITTEDGQTLDGEILFTFEANGDDYILYVVGEEVFASKVDEEGNLKPVEEDEWRLIEKVYQEYLEDTEGEDE